MRSVPILLVVVSAAIAVHVVVSRDGEDPAILPGADFAVHLSPVAEAKSLAVPLLHDAYLIRARNAEGSLQVQDLRRVNITTVHLMDSEYYVAFVPQYTEAQIRFDSLMVDCDKELLVVEGARTSATSLGEVRAVRGNSKQDAVDSIDGELYVSELKTLSEGITSTRYTYTVEEIRKSAAWIQGELEGYGYTVTQPTYMLNGVECTNVVAVLQGTTKPEEVVVVGAHYDSIAEASRRETLAPGAVDNGSGTIGVMLAARALAGASFERTIQFVLFSGEEQGLHGSTAFVKAAQENGVNVVSAVIFDMIAYSNRHFGVTIEGTTNSAIQQLMTVVERNTVEYRDDQSLTVHRVDRSFGSDHVPFQRAGIPAILLIERDDTNYPHYHRSTDVVNEQNVNAAQSRNIVKGAVAATWDLAGGSSE